VLNAAWAVTIAVVLQTSPARPSPASQAWPDQQPITHFFQNLVHDVGALPSTRTALVLGVGGAGALAAHPVDDNLAGWVRGRDASSYTSAGQVLGNGWTQGGAAIAVYLVGKLDGNPAVTHIGGDLIRGQALNGLVTTAIKVAVDRTRPNGSRYSFPSGHTTASFTTAAILDGHFGWKVGVPAYAVAGFVGWTRIRDNVHWLSDVVFGGAIGVMVGRTVTAGHRARTWTVLPVKTPGGFAVMIVGSGLFSTDPGQ
jgi:membrane-associated phospholipid phosphatase